MHFVRRLRSSSLAITTFIVVTVSVSQCIAVSFAGLGELPGRSFGSSATDVSADGRVVVGCSVTASQTVATHWTRQTGLVALPPVPLNTNSRVTALAISADGLTIVGDAENSG